MACISLNIIGGHHSTIHLFPASDLQNKACLVRVIARMREIVRKLEAGAPLAVGRAAVSDATFAKIPPKQISL